MELTKHIEKIAVNNTLQETYIPEVKIIDGVEFYVVPVVMMVEGVHNGSQGAVYHSADELAKSIPNWPNIPVTISHPFVEDSYVSVNSVNKDEWVVGYVEQASMKDNKLTANIYLEVNKLIAISPSALEMIRDQKIIEVSIGVFTDDIENAGIWHEEPYEKIATNHKPDHLALLPEEIGACSVEDGCGIRVNNEKEKGGKHMLNVNRDVIRSLENEGFKIIPQVNAEGLKEKLDKIRQSLYAQESDTRWLYLEEVYDDYAVFSENVREKTTEGYYKDVSNALYKQTYQINDDGTVSWTGVPVKVVRKVDYIQVNKKEVKMCVKCEEKAKALVAHANTNFDESDIAWLSELTEDKLDKLIPKVNKQQVTVEDAVKVIQSNAKEMKDYLSVLPNDVKDQVEKGLEIFAAQKSEVVQNILTNTDEGTWTEDELNTMSFEVLKKVEKTLAKGDFSMRGVGAYQQKENSVAPLLPITNNGTKV